MAKCLLTLALGLIERRPDWIFCATPSPHQLSSWPVSFTL
jgi:hypothetical protein